MRARRRTGAKLSEAVLTMDRMMMSALVQGLSLSLVAAPGYVRKRHG